MFNGNGHTPTTWQGVAAMAITLAYRLLAIYMFGRLFSGQREMLEVLEKLSSGVGLGP
jgi:hypothetical protein